MILQLNHVPLLVRRPQANYKMSEMLVQDPGGHERGSPCAGRVSVFVRACLTGDCQTSNDAPFGRSHYGGIWRNDLLVFFVEEK